MAIFILAGFGFPAADTKAASSDPTQNATSSTRTNTSVCSVQEEMQALTQSLGNPLEDYNLQLKKELDLRKSLTAKIIACALSEANSVKQNLAGLQTNDPDITRRKNELSQEIDRTIVFYKNQANSVPGLGLRSSQETAEKIRDWRTSTFYPALQAINNLSLWVHDDGLIQTAGTRNKQITQTVKSLGLADNSDINSKIGDAAKALAEANDAHASARTEIIKPSWDNESLAYIKLSLEKLGEVYHNFLAISDLVQAKLKTK